MQADTFAKLNVLEALIEAEIGYYLERSPASLELFREGMVARISDLVDEVDELDSVASARVYDAIVDFLAELPDAPEGIVEATVRLRRAVDRIIDRGMDRSDLAAAATWAVVLDELLEELADEYHLAVDADGEIHPREFARVEALLSRARNAADRMLWGAEAAGPEIRDEIDRLAFAVRHRRIRPPAVDLIIGALQRRATQYRPSTLSRIGGFVLRQLVGRESRRRGRGTRLQTREGRAGSGEPTRAG